MAKPDLPKFDEDLQPVEFEQLNYIQRRNRNLTSIFIIIFFLAMVLYFGIRYYQRSRQPVPPAEETPAGENLWVPGIDYQPEEEGGE